MTVSGVRKAYGDVVALDGVDLRVAAGEVVAVVGPERLREVDAAVAGVRARRAGRRHRGRARGRVDAAARRAAAVAERARQRGARAAGRRARRSGAARAAAHAHFVRFGLEGFEKTRPAALSGGMRQRVAFLRTLLAGRPLLCLDEPFGALDALTRTQAQTWLAEALAQEPRTVLLVTHDVEEAVLLADRVVLLSPRPGRVVSVLDVPLAAPARAHGPRRRRAARAGARARSGWRRDRAAARPRGADRRLGAARPRRTWSTRCCCPRRAPSPRRCGRTARSSRRTSPSRPARSCSGCVAALVLGVALAVAMHLVPVDRPGAAAARGRLAGRADPGARAADRVRARVRAGAEDPDRRADLLLPDRGQRRRRPARRRPRRAPRAARAGRLALAAAALPGGAVRAAVRVHRAARSPPRWP